MSRNTKQSGTAAHFPSKSFNGGFVYYIQGLIYSLGYEKSNLAA